jgi:hypothetical protein
VPAERENAIIALDDIERQQGRRVASYYSVFIAHAVVPVRSDARRICPHTGASTSMESKT